MDDRVARQEAIGIITNKVIRTEVMLRLDGILQSGFQVRLRFVPDRYRLAEGALGQYFSTIPQEIQKNVHDSALVILDDLNNQLVPKWIQVMVDGGDTSALVEDRQPQWQNAPLLSRQVFF